MVQPRVFVVAAIVSAVSLGCSGDDSGKLVYRCGLRSHEIRIIRTKRFLENAHLYYQVIGPDEVIKDDTYLGTEYSRSFKFSSVVDEEDGILAVVEDDYPTVFVVAFDLNTKEVWPDWDASPEDRSAMEDRVAKHLARFTGKSGWTGGEVVSIRREGP
jgi:hypothetical protein